MPHCFVTTCNNYYGRTRGNARIKYHMLPTTAISEAWIELCGYEKGSRPPSYARVCSAHFSSNCYERDLQHELLGLPLRKKLKKDAVPDQLLPKGTQSLLPHSKSSTISEPSILSNGNSTLMTFENQETNLKRISSCPSLNPNQLHNQKSNGTKTRTQLTNPKQTNITTDLDEAFKQFQASIENNFMNNNKDESDNYLISTNNTSTPKNKLTNMNKSKNKQKLTNQRENTNVNSVVAKKTTVKEKSKAAIKLAVNSNKAKKNISIKEKNCGNVLKTGKKGVSLDEKSVKQTLNLKKEESDEKSRRKTSSGIPNSSNKKIQTKNLSKNSTTSDESHSDHSRNTENVLSNIHQAGPSPVQKTKGKVPIYEKIDTVKNSASASGTQTVKTQNLKNKIPIRSSYRIAKKKSIESLSDSFTQKVNRSVESKNTWENFTDKLKFMAKLQLRFGKYDQERDVNNRSMVPTSLKFPSTEDESLQKMRIMEDVREGCIVQPSSPGHAELRPDNETTEETCQKSEDSQNEDASEYCDQIEVDSVKQELDVKSPSTDHGNNADCEPKNSQKRKQDDEETSVKRLRSDIEENFRQRDKILNDFMDIIDTDNATSEQLRVHSEQLLSEIKSMNELAREKEMEWNNIIHLKKIKEELLIRIERKRQISLMNGDKPDSDGDNDERAKQSSISFQRYMLSRSSKIELANRNRHILPKPPHYDLNGSFDPRQGVRNRPTLDVQSIIADYRQRHPEAVPRRGRRIRNSHNGSNGNSGILNFSSMALGSGSQMKHNLQDMGNELNMLLSVMDANRGDTSRPSSADSSHDTASFKDILVQFAKLSQNERNELLQNAMKPPPPYPEVTVHPVTTVTSSPTNSLLHGILTKSPLKPNNKTAFSPTLARLLTAPERAGNHLTSSPLITSSHNHPSNMSISEILSTSKARNEITITPVDSQFDQPMKGSKAMNNAEDDETEDSADRLVIDESNEDGRRTLDNTSDGEDEVPPCQGCNQKIAQFVCAGCGRQWYCSRDCQVAAWDEHSEVCTG